MLTIDGETLETTAEHPFYELESAPWLVAGEQQGRWTDALDMQVGDQIWQADGITGTVESITVVPVRQRMYNLSVDTAHTFFVGQQQWLVHNCDYRDVFFKANPSLESKVVVHHSVEQQVLDRYPGLFTEAEIHSLDNLRGIPISRNADLHLSRIRKEWNNFYRKHATGTKQEILDFATKIDAQYGHLFTPTEVPYVR